MIIHCWQIYDREQRLYIIIFQIPHPILFNILKFIIFNTFIAIEKEQLCSMISILDTHFAYLNKILMSCKKLTIMGHFYLYNKLKHIAWSNCNKMMLPSQIFIMPNWRIKMILPRFEHVSKKSLNRTCTNYRKFVLGQPSTTCTN